MAASNMAMSVSNSGHGFAMTASASQLSAAAQLSETFGGMTQVRGARREEWEGLEGKGGWGWEGGVREARREEWEGLGGRSGRG